METKPPLPPFTPDSAGQKVRMAEDAWNSRDPDKVVLVYTDDTHWRNRAEFPVGREQVRRFLQRKWAKELDYRLIKELWAVPKTASRSASPTSGTTTPTSGFAATATRTGSSTHKASCIGASPASTTCRSPKASASSAGLSVGGRMDTLN
jgi:uncharacterized protein DUF1348